MAQVVVYPDNGVSEDCPPQAIQMAKSLLQEKIPEGVVATGRDQSGKPYLDVTVNPEDIPIAKALATLRQQLQGVKAVIHD